MSLVANKKAGFDYELGERMIAGVELFGYEVKSLRAKQGSLEGAYIIVRGGEALLIGAYIPPFQPANAPKDYNDRRNRILLLHKAEIALLADAERQKQRIIALSFFEKGSKIKLELAIAIHKKKADKRHSIKKRDQERDIKRKL